MPLLIWFAIVAPLIGTDSARAEALAQRRVLAMHMAELADSLPALWAKMVSDDQGGDAPPVALTGDTDAVASAALEQRVQEMAARAGAVLSSTETLAAVPVGGYRRVGLRVSLAAPWPVLIGLLEAVERARPSMLIDDLDLHSRPALINVPEPPLDVGFTVLGFRAHTVATGPETR